MNIRTILGPLASVALFALGVSPLACSKSRPVETKATQTEESTGSAVAEEAPAEPAPEVTAARAATASAAAAEAAALVIGTVCIPPKAQIANAAKCAACEAENCSAAGVSRGCDNITDPEKKKLCFGVLRCIRSTNCIAGGDVSCYCGTAPLPRCKETPAADGTNPADGACKAEITAAFGANEPASIVNQIGIITLAHGAALALGRCDRGACGESSASECVPYCQ